MTDRAHLIETQAGLIGAVVSEPEGPPRAAAVILPGHSSTRAGINRVWARVARRLAADGIVTLRFDYPTTGESHDAVHGDMLLAVDDVARWFDERTGDVDLLIISYCIGLAPAVRFSTVSDRVARAIVVTPPMAQPGARRPPSATTRVATRLRSLMRPRRAVVLARRRWYQWRYGAPVRPRVSTGTDRQAMLGPPGVMQLAERTKVRVVAGELDDCAAAVSATRDELEAVGSSVDIVAAKALFIPSTQDLELLFDLVVDWACAGTARVEATP